MKAAVLFACFCFFFGGVVQAQIFGPPQVVQALSTGAFSVGIGSTIQIDSQPRVFLGELINHDGSSNSLMVLDQSKATVSYVPASLFSAIPQGGQAVLKLYPQEGGTCTGYALDGFLLQTHLSGFSGNGELAKTVSTEAGRTALLVDAINQYYLVLQHRFSIVGILNGYGKRFGFSCGKKIFNDVQVARDFVKTSLKTGQPVLVAFNIGPKMFDGPFKLQRTEVEKGEDVRLWLPRKIGERNSGGHSVVAVGGFATADSEYLVMLDSDWDMPRVWDMNQVFTSRTAIGEVEFYTCK